MNPTPSLELGYQAEFPIDKRTPREHPLLSQLPRWDDNRPEFFALVDSISDQGVLEPVKITVSGLLIDGRHRLSASRRMNKATIPAIVVPDEEAAAIAIASLIHRRHMTDGQRAYSLVNSGLIDAAFDERRNRQIANLKSGKKTTEANPIPPERHSVSLGEKRVDNGVEEWATKLGVSVTLLKQARTVCELFEDTVPRTITDRDGVEEVNVTFRDFFEVRILRDTDPYGLGAVITACQSLLKMKPDHTGGKPQAPDRQLTLFSDGFKTIEKRFTYWTGWDIETKRSAVVQIRPFFEAMPADFLEDVAKLVTTEKQRRKAQEKEAA